MNTPRSSSLIDSRTGDAYSLRDAVLRSQPSSGGLFTPRKSDLPRFSKSDIATMSGLSFQDLAKMIHGNFDWGIDPDEATEKTKLSKAIDEAYGSQWHDTDITPVKEIGENRYSLHLGYGPTFAFKNVALEFLPRILALLTPDTRRKVLGASSGDTINAAHHGVKGTNISSLFMLPSTGPSAVQRLQATNGIVDNPNALTLLVDAPFDPLQDAVKKLNSPEYADFKAEYNVTSFNSINIARILAQVVYYFRAYSQLVKTYKIKNGDEVTFSVPSGNFGDALAGLYAREMGLPVGRINVATNENSMLHKFFETGVYKPPKDGAGKDYVQVTNAPSQDIAKSSNFERALLWACRDPEQVAAWYRDLTAEGKFVVDENTLRRLRSVFTSSTCTDRERLETIQFMASAFEHGIDPHTATGVHPITTGKFAEEEVVIFLETSHTAQFADEMDAQGIVVPGMHEFDETLNAMKAKTPVEGVHFLRSTADFESIFDAVRKGMQILDTRN